MLKNILSKALASAAGPLMLAIAACGHLETSFPAPPVNIARPGTVSVRPHIATPRLSALHSDHLGQPRLTLTETDILNLIKTTSTEVDASLPASERVRMSIGVAETILNRLACGCFKGTTVADIVNQRWQFSAINSSLPYAYGSVELMPETAIKPLVRKDVEVWLSARARGVPAQESGLSFLNPNYSSARALLSWGWAVVREAEASGHVYGDLRRRSVHYHGTAPGLYGKEPKPYGISLPEGWEPH